MEGNEHAQDGLVEDAMELDKLHMISLRVDKEMKREEWRRRWWHGAKSISLTSNCSSRNSTWS